ncbi:MAG: bifunctional serine/threonine-protein kinase/universal stress protein [Betaproteobacteria bacterium]
MTTARIRPGEEIGGFRVDGALHAGGNGYVYAVHAARDGAPATPLVMKVPAVGPGEPSIGIVSFEIEQRILPTLTGSHVPAFVATGDAGTIPWIVMERIDGEGLAAIASRAPLAVDEVAAIGAGLADAVHAVHRQDVVHLDVKPENFIRRASGDWVLLDYGFSRHARYPDLLAEERHHAAGSAAYVSPEQVGGDRSDPRSDVFALGVLLYELATGELPFGEPTTIAGLGDRRWRAPAPPRSLRADLPPWLQEIILHALEADAAQRYASAAHLAFDLRHPEAVALTKRSRRTEADGLFAQFRAWWRSRQADVVARPHANDAPVVLVAVDTSHPDDERHPALRDATRAIIASSGDFRLMFVSVIVAAPVGEGERPEDSDSGRALEHRHRLRHWVEPLRLPPARQSLHVVVSGDPADTLLELAEVNHVDLIVLGAPDPSERALAWYRSVASTVTANARCSVHVVRVPARSVRADAAAPRDGDGPATE